MTARAGEGAPAHGRVLRAGSARGDQADALADLANRVGPLSLPLEVPLDDGQVAFFDAALAKRGREASGRLTRPGQDGDTARGAT